MAVLRQPHWEQVSPPVEKYPHTRDFAMMVLEALTDFSVAEQHASIETFPPVSWNEVKDFCVKEVQRIGRNWFEPG